VLLCCVNNEEAQKLLQETHGSSNFFIHVGGHFSAKTIAFKIIRKGHYWPSIFFMTLMFFRDLVTSAKNLLGKNAFHPCCYNLSYQSFHFESGGWILLVLLILRLQQDKFLF
jgi:hypothetical protein